MDSQGLVHHRKKRVLARTLGAFEDQVLPLMKPELTADERRAVEAFKQGVRDSFESLATDACDYLTFNGNVNGAAIDLRDRMAPAGSRPASTRS
jgi:hypothetical protein